MSTAYETLIVEREGAIALISINRPKALNALNGQVLRELSRALRELLEPGAGALAVRALILTGAGEKAFVAGADIAEMAPMTPWQAREFSLLGHAAAELLETLPCATIAAVNGYALGGGLEMALGCDLLYAAEGARLGAPEVNLGVIPGFGGTVRLAQRIGVARAKELIFTGEMIDARKAHELGLALEVMPKDQLLPFCKGVAQKIAGKGPLAIARAKELITHSLSLPTAAACAQEAESFALLFDTNDRRAGMQAFLEKKTATFTGT